MNELASVMVVMMVLAVMLVVRVAREAIPVGDRRRRGADRDRDRARGGRRHPARNAHTYFPSRGLVN
jgi:hypothetical protein